MKHLYKSACAVLAAGMIAFSGAASAAESMMHKLVIHVDDNDAAKMNLALNNASNVVQAYMAKNEDVFIEIVAYGPGLTMLTKGDSPVADRLASIHDNYPGSIQYRACGNTMAGVQKRTGKEVALLPNVQVVPSGVVHLMERQEQGWSYLRP